MKRGDLVTIAMQGDFGKPRPALILQSDVFSDIHETITVAPLSSKIISVRKEKIGKVIGSLDDTILVRVNRALALWLGLA